jgi:hypothetical protein
MLKIAGKLSALAVAEEFALQNFPQTRAKSDGLKAAVCAARLAPNFHHKHVQLPLAGSRSFCLRNEMGSLKTHVASIH